MTMQTNAGLWFVGLCLVALYCVVRVVLDIRQGRNLWAALGLAATAVIMLAPVPIQTHAVKIDLPIAP
jgi:uncharacterized membrane protein